MGADRVDRTERLLNLVVCLMASRVPVPRERIVEQIPGYRDAPSLAALERMFERDKDDLRALGVPLQTVLNAHGEVEGYRIAREDYVLPDIALTDAERSAVNAAAAAWQSGSLGAVAAVGAAKLQSRQPTSVGGLEMPTFVQFDHGGNALFMCLRALRWSRRLSFRYRKPGAAVVEERHVDPWGVVAREGHWYLIGHDVDRGEQRVFRISRIDGTVRVLASAIARQRPDGFDVRGAVDGERAEALQATVWVSSNAAAEVRRFDSSHALAIDAAGTIDIDTAAATRFLHAVRGAGTQAVLLEPPDLRSAVIEGLGRVLAAHERETG